MYKVIVNPGTDQSWEIPLAPGVTILGSDPALLYPITHETVSPSHCEIEVAPSEIKIRDLGSQYGTFVEHAPVTEARLASGQAITLGEVQLQLLSDAPVRTPGRPPVPVRVSAPMPAGAVTANAQPDGPFCKFHPHAAAKWHCAPCNAWFCDLCVNMRRTSDVARHLCRKCGNECEPVAVQYREVAPENFYASLPGAFAYPFRGNGPALLAGGTVFFTLLSVFIRMAGFLVYGALIGLGAAVFGTGYLFSYAKDIINSTGRGTDEPPDWPDFTSFSEFIGSPAMQALSLILFTLGPGLVLIFWHPFGSGYALLIAATALALGALFAPMGMLLIAIYDTIGALNPVPLVWSIRRLGLPYFAAAILFEMVLAACYLVKGKVSWLHLPPAFGFLVMYLIQLYTITVAMRILGLLYRTQKHRLGWRV